VARRPGAANAKADADPDQEFDHMAKAKTHPTDAPAKYASVDFSGYRPGADYPFRFDVSASDAAGNHIHGPARMCCDRAVETALYILTVAAGFEGLKDEEREKLRSIAAMEPAWGYCRGADRISQMRAKADARRISAAAG
jgi:hypothetical protein